MTTQTTPPTPMSDAADLPTASATQAALPADETSALSRLEQSFADIAAQHRLTSFAVVYRGEEFGACFRFSSTGHFDDALPGQFGCANGDGATIGDAINEMLREALSRRVNVVGDLPGDEPLIWSDVLARARGEAQ